uniref:BTB domain-containing protein n=1 Tax=Panagrellus redivivus TaxID=6233 RepID=A0A7E4V7S8_PANRE
MLEGSKFTVEISIWVSDPRYIITGHIFFKHPKKHTSRTLTNIDLVHFIETTSGFFDSVSDFVVECDITFKAPSLKLSPSIKSMDDMPTDETNFKLTNPVMFELAETANHYPPDAEIVVASDVVKAHKWILSILSPVFQKHFSQNNAGSKNGIYRETLFKMETVQSVVDYCYGRDIGEKSITDIIDMLRYADQFGIKTVTKKLNDYPHEQLNMETFSLIALFAWDLQKEDLKTECITLFKENILALTLTPEFVGLPTEVRDGILRGAMLLNESK